MKKEESIATGIRIPKNLYETVKSAEPNKTFSEIIRCVLEKEYGSSSFKPNVCTLSDNTKIDDDFSFKPVKDVDKELKELQKILDELQTDE